jgi:hypothetical protein
VVRPSAPEDLGVEDRALLDVGRNATMNKVLGIVLVVLGVVGPAWGGFAYTSRERVADVGPIHATRDKTHFVSLPPLGGTAALPGGVALLLAGSQK